MSSIKRWLALTCCFFAQRAAAGPVQLPEFQKKYLAEAQATAREASKLAEEQLLNDFRSPLFRLKLLLQGWSGWKLALKSPEELLEDVRDSLHSLEFLFSFGLDPAAAKLHPGQPDWNIKGIDQYGHIPTLWELKVDGKADALPKAQWELVDAEETGLYRVPEFSKVAEPNMTEARLRPGYVSGNIARFDQGIFQFGFYAPIYRQSVLKERAVVIGLDGGGWETVCNASSNMNRMFRYLKHFVSCDAIYAGGKKSINFATIDNLMHAFYANTRTMSIFGGTLARRLYQILIPGATLHPLENNMYLEAALFGPARMEDMKVFVASFPDVFGTDQVDDLREFCKRHRLPLAWGLGGGKLRSHFDMSHKLMWFPHSPFADWPAYGDRLLDPSSWEFVNVKSPPGVTAAWTTVESKVKTARLEDAKTKTDTVSDKFSGWWTTLKAAGGVVRNLHGRECADQIDLCFGTSGDAGTKGQCLMRELPGQPSAPVPQLAGLEPKAVIV